MFWLWSQNGGDLFCVFSDIGGYSQWGSWGLLETQNQPINISYKYQVWASSITFSFLFFTYFSFKQAVEEMIQMYNQQNKPQTQYTKIQIN